jgi:hypothetical protein
VGVAGCKQSLLEERNTGIRKSSSVRRWKSRAFNAAKIYIIFAEAGSVRKEEKFSWFQS